ncbi:MAG: AAA family ATPase [Syntrophobacteraceae bacterium]|nr:AAA family ATPase [Syntrophobacteraceae bacterium]
MYRDHFGFKENPFSIAPDPRYLYMSEQHKEALAHLLYGVKSEGGFVLLTGEVGTGKTTVCRCLLEQLPENADVAFIFNPKLTVKELLSTICDELHIRHTGSGKSVKTYVDLINTHLLDAFAKGRITLLIIDEAQNLSRSVLEQIRLLTNLETNQRKLLQIILLGQPELLDTLAEPKLRQLSQRIIARYHLGPLTRAEVRAYVSHRLAVAGAKAQVFPESLVAGLHKLSGGIPRLINTICDRALLGAYTQGKDSVDRKTLENAAREVRGDPGWRNRVFPVPPHWVAAGVMLLAAFGFFFATVQQKTRPSVSERRASGNPGVQGNPSIYRKPIPGLRKSPGTEEQTGSIQHSSSAASEGDPSVSSRGLPPSSAKEVIPAQPVHQETPARVEGQDPNARSGSLKWLEGRSEHKNISFAFHDLLKLWGVDAKPEDQQEACSRAEAHKLQCLSSHGDVQELRTLNLPAILKLRDSRGDPAYAVLTRLGERTATLTGGTESVTITLEELTAGWKGEYTLLWRTPPDYQRNVKGGDTGPFVTWVAASLARLHGKGLSARKDPVFDEELLQQVKQFQLTKGLKTRNRRKPSKNFILQRRK